VGPIRFLWQTDPGGTLAYLSPAAAALVAAPQPGETFRAFAARALGGGGDIARALDGAEAWSGLAACWPPRAGVRPVRVELSAAPAPGGGWRGFGLALLEPRPAAQDEGLGEPAAEHPSEAPGDDTQPGRPSPSNIVRFPRGGPAAPPEGGLGPDEAAAFREIGAALGGPLTGSASEAPPAPRVVPALGMAVAPALLARRHATRAAGAHGTEALLLAARAEAEELRAILDTAADGVIVFGADGRVELINRPAQALFDLTAAEARGRHVTRLFAAESQRAVIDYLDALSGGGRAAAFNEGRELVAIERQGGRVPLFVTIGRLGARDGEPSRYCAVLRDATHAKRAERELVEARRRAELARRDKADALERLGQEIRRPLGSILGLTEAMLAERFGPLGNERYRGALADIRESSESLLTLVGEIVDLARAEAGRLDLVVTEVRLGDLARQAVGALQAQANRDGVILRTALPPTPAVLADGPTLRQAVFQLVAGAVRATRRGGQVIVSTGVADDGGVYLRVRDRSPARAAPGGGVDPAGLALPLTKALAEANQAAMTVEARAGEGTVVEIAFPRERVAAAPAAFGSA
jgi:PAS domain S-box-containing protein